LAGYGSRLPAKATEGCHMFVGNLEAGQRFGKRLLVELRVGSGPRHRSDVRDKSDIGPTQQRHERLEAPVGMADGEERQRHRTRLPARALKSAALVGGDMVGLVAFDLVLGIVLRGVMDMALV